MRHWTQSREVGPLLRLSIPTVIAQLGQVLLGIVGATFAGRLGVEALDAVALGSVWQVATMLPLSGVVTGYGALISHAHGAGRERDVAVGLQRALLIAVVLSLPVALAWNSTAAGLVMLGQDPALARLAGDYVRTQLFSAPCFLIYSALSTYLSSIGIVHIGIAAMAVANLFNAFASWALMFGHFGLPALGIEGAAIATGLTELSLPVVTGLLIVRSKLPHVALMRWTRERVFGAGMLRQLRLGAPSGVTLALELWAFQLGTILAGKLDPIALGAHAIALNLASATFMVPLGFSNGTASHVGQLIGAGERERARDAAHVALKILASYALCAGGVFVIARELLPGLYSRDPNIVRAVASVLPIAGAFQLFDGLSAAGSGILRGMGRPQVIAKFNAIGYFAIGVPLAFYLSLHTALGLRGIWIGYAAGLFFVSAGLVGSVLLRGPDTADPLG